MVMFKQNAAKQSLGFSWLLQSCDSLATAVSLLDIVGCIAELAATHHRDCLPIERHKRLSTERHNYNADEDYHLVFPHFYFVPFLWCGGVHTYMLCSGIFDVSFI